MSKYGPLATGISLFIAFFSIGMVVIYGAAPLWQKQQFVSDFFANSPWTGGYFEFWNFVWWLIMVPIMIFLFLFYPASKVGKQRRGFHR